MARLYLASRSPRRRELLLQIGVRFEPLLLRLMPVPGGDADEIQKSGESPADYVERTARGKAQLGLTTVQQRAMRPKPVLAADTVVIVDGEVLGKPADPLQAAAFLRRLSGRSHEVRTAVAIGVPSGAGTQLLQATSISQVTFKALNAQEIERYCTTREPYDKAGGYAIQGLAAVFIERIEGSYSGVMGLPLFETAQLLQAAGIQVL